MNIKIVYKRFFFEIDTKLFTYTVCLMFKMSLFRAYVKGAVVFTFLVLWLVLICIFGPRKDKACCPVFIFRRGIYNAIWVLVLYLLYEGLNISLIYDGTIAFQYLGRAVAVQDSTVSETGK